MVLCSKMLRDMPVFKPMSDPGVFTCAGLQPTLVSPVPVSSVPMALPKAPPPPRGLKHPSPPLSHRPRSHQLRGHAWHPPWGCILSLGQGARCVCVTPILFIYLFWQKLRVCTGDKKPGRQLTGWVAGAMMESIHHLPRQEAMGTPCARIAYLEQCPCGHPGRKAGQGCNQHGHPLTPDKKPQPKGDVPPSSHNKGYPSEFSHQHYF